MVIILAQYCKIGQRVEKWSDFGYVTMQRSRFLMKYISFPSQNWLTHVSMIIWSHYDINVVRMREIGENVIVIFVKIANRATCRQIKRLWLCKFEKISLSHEVHITSILKSVDTCVYDHLTTIWQNIGENAKNW